LEGTVAKQTNIKVKEVSPCIWKGEQGFFVVLLVESQTRYVAVNACITDPADVKKLEELYQGEVP